MLLMENTFSPNLSASKDEIRLKFVFYRPHANIWFKNTVGRILKRKLFPNKYAPLLEYLLQSEVDVYFSSGLQHDSSLKSLFKAAFDGFELVLWCLLNRINFSKVSLIFKRRTLEEKNILFLMHYGNLTYETEEGANQGLMLAQNLAALNIFKVVHLTHFAYCPLTGSNNLALLKPDLLVAENNLKNNSIYYNKYFKIIDNQFLCLPYVAASRFQNTKSFLQRINKIVVTGSITYKMKSPEFIDFFATDELQPMRRKLYEQATLYNKQMDCLVSDLNASRVVTEAKHSKSQGIRAARVVESSSTQFDYYKKDIVDIYNTYTMFAVPEEICGLPAIGFVEGMACGSVYFGLDDPMYQNLGMNPGVHYVSYDGTVIDLMAKVNYYQQHPTELAQIGEAGSRFVLEHLSPTVVYSNFVRQLRMALDLSETVH
jgi:hypothetical protein